MVHASMDLVDPIAHGSVLLDFPFDPDFPQLSEDEFGWVSQPGSPESRSALSPDIFHGFQVDQVLLSRSQDKSDALSWDSILHGIQDMPAQPHKGVVPPVTSAATTAAVCTTAKPELIGSVMWDGSDGEDMGPPPLRSFFHGMPPSSRGEIDFHAFIQEDMSSDEEVHIADGEIKFGAKRRKTVPTPAAQIEAKKAKLVALRIANQQPEDCAVTAVQRAKDELLMNSETPEGKRHTHNVLERKRREDLKISYQELRLQVPELITAERAPTGQILIKAAEFIALLKAEEEQMAAQLAIARAQNANLKRLRHGVQS